MEKVINYNIVCKDEDDTDLKDILLIPTPLFFQRWHQLFQPQL